MESVRISSIKSALSSYKRVLSSDASKWQQKCARNSPRASWNGYIVYNAFAPVSHAMNASCGRLYQRAFTISVTRNHHHFASSLARPLYLSICVVMETVFSRVALGRNVKINDSVIIIRTSNWLSRPYQITSDNLMAFDVSRQFSMRFAI